VEKRPSSTCKANRLFITGCSGSGQSLDAKVLLRSQRRASSSVQHLRFFNGIQEEQMISGAHVVVYSKNAEADRAFFHNVLGFKSVDAGHGWLIFALPPAEAAFHPSEESAHELYFMCDDLKTEIASLAKKGVECSQVEEARWGSITKMRLPGGGSIGLYQPKHPIALGLK
jgi:catechol 2,3-dioxygenase-like lactoylglutathione lyase family enzyme